MSEKLPSEHGATAASLFCDAGSQCVRNKSRTDERDFKRTYVMTFVSERIAVCLW